MKTIDKLMLKSFLGPMVLSFFIVMFVLLMNFMWKFIDELVGKGLGLGVIFELMMYVTITVIPMGLPLATLFGSIMTLGNLGENYELLAMKSAGMSLMRILQPLLIVVGFVAVGSFFIANNLVPFSMKQMNALMYDIKQQKQTIDFKDGIFFNTIDNMAIRVGRQTGENKLLTDILIYDNRQYDGNMSVTLADSGYIKISDDKKFLLVTLHNGVMYDQTRNYRWHDNNALTRNYFTEQNAVISLAGFDFARTDTELFTGSATMNVMQLKQNIDSLREVVKEGTLVSYEPLFNNYIFHRDNTVMTDSLRKETPHLHPVMTIDSINKLDVRARQQLWRNALSAAESSRGAFSFDERQLKLNVTQLYNDQVSWHEKVSLPVSIVIFFLIGAALGAIIRKGGLGMPVVVSVIFFVLYYIINLAGKRMAQEGTLTAFQGMWLSVFILLPLAIFLIYKATNDSNLFNAEWYIYRYRELKGFVNRIFKSKKPSNDTDPKSA